MVRRHEGILDLNAVRTAGAHAERLIAAPIVEDAQLVARHRNTEDLRRSVDDAQQRATDQMRGVRDAEQKSDRPLIR